MTDLRDAILARLDGYDADHRPMAGDPETGCCPGGCVADAVAALRAVLDEHARDYCHNCTCTDCSDLPPCPEVRVIAAAMRIWEGSTDE